MGFCLFCQYQSVPSVEVRIHTSGYRQGERALNDTSVRDIAVYNGNQVNSL
jgi:hypothetical protein